MAISKHIKIFMQFSCLTTDKLAHLYGCSCYFYTLYIIFLIKSLKSSGDHFNIKDFISSAVMQQDQDPTPGCAIFAQPPEYHHTYIYFKRLPWLWNALPPINMNQFGRTIKNKLTRFLYTHFIYKHICIQ